MHIRPHTYTKDGLTVLWQPDKCIHSGICVRGLSSVFNPKKSPWVDINEADAGVIAKQVELCPSGALTVLLPAN